MIPSSFTSGNTFRLWVQNVDYTWNEPVKGTFLKQKEISEVYDICERLKYYIRNVENPKV